MKKVICLVAVVSFLATDTNAQWFRIKKKPRVETEQEEQRPLGFEVNGFARDKDTRDVRVRTANDNALTGFTGNEKAEVKMAKKEAKKVKISKKTGLPRNRDIETLMTDLTLAKIQRPVFKGIMTEHLRDVTNVLSSETTNAADKNVMLKQMYALRNKRLQETLNDAQFKIWLRIKDQDEYLDIARPDDE
jgi:hypothetical protein